MSEKDLVNRIVQLLQKRLDGSASMAEIRELNEWKDQSAANTQLYDEWMNPAIRENKLFDYMEIDVQAEAEGQAWEDSLPREVTNQFTKTARIIPFKRILYAAAAIVVIAFLSAKFLLQHPEKANEMSTPAIARTDVPAPTGSKTTLTLSNGAKVVLDDAKNGILARQGTTDITKAKDGQLVYTATQHETPAQFTYNTLATARGGQTQLLLADGTKVWLNSSSSITYPTAFADKNRSVKITGEAYFEVAKDKTKPFIVSALDMNIQVLGTSFNIHDYEGEPTKTTLLQGSVKIVGANEQDKGIILKPAQQAQLNKDGKLKIVDKVDTEQTTAWLNGKFAFDDENIIVIMQQLARWYDLDIIYEGQQSAVKLTASVSKRSSLSAVLKALEMSGVHCRLEGKKLFVK